MNNRSSGLLAGVILAAHAGLAADPSATAPRLVAERAKLAELRATCKETHPLVIQTRENIRQLETRAQFEGRKDGELQIAKSRLADLRKTCRDAHPLVQEQLKKIAALEKASRSSGAP